MIKKTTIQLAFLFLVVATLTSCVKGIKAEPLIGLTYSYNGLSVENVQLINAETNSQLKDKKLKAGETLYIVMKGVKGFTITDDLIHPICKLTITDPEGNVVLQSENLYANQGDITKDINEFAATIKLANPGKTYTTTVNLYDEMKPENKIDVTVSSDVIE